MTFDNQKILLYTIERTWKSFQKPAATVFGSSSLMQTIAIGIIT